MKVLTKCVAFGAVGLMALSSCSDENPWKSADGKSGRILPQLITDTKVTDAVPTRASQELVAPDVNDFSLKLSKIDGSFEKTWTRLSEFPTEQGFAIGDYTLEAWYGDVNEEGLNRPCYFGSSQLSVEPDETTQATVTATLANTMVSVAYTDAFKKYFSTYSVTLHSEGHGYNTLLADEEDPMFLAPGNVTVSLTFTKTDGTGATIEPANFQADARHHYHITMDVNGGNVGSAALTISFDDSVVEEDVTIDLSDELIRSAAPEIAADGFTNGAVINLLQGTRYDNTLKFNIFAAANMKEARLTVESADYTLPLGSNNEVNLMSLEAAEQSVAQSLGIRCIGLYKNPDKMAMVDLTEFAAKLPVGTHKMILVAKDKLTRVSEPVKVTVSIDPIELAFVGDPGALYGATTAKFTMQYNGTDFADKVSFKVKQENGQFVDAPVVDNAAKPARHAATRSEAFPVKDYEVTITIPRCVFDMPIEVYYLGNKMLSATLRAVVPNYYVEASAFATRAYLKVVPENPQDAATIIDNLVVYANGSKVATSNVDRNPETGVVCVSGLTPASDYTLTTNLSATSSEMKTNTVLTTESLLAVPNGDFETLEEKYSASGEAVAQGGRYSITLIPVWKTNYQTFSVSEPQYWATTNPKTLNASCANKNSWFYIASVFNTSLSLQSVNAYPLSHGATTPAAYEKSAHGGNNAMVIRNVAWDLNGITPADDSKTTGSSGYYCRNIPKRPISNRSAGRLFLGSYSYSGGVETFNQGVSFASRPLSLSGYYMYELGPVDDEKCTVSVKVRNGSKVIGQGSVALGAADSYTQFSVNIAYNDFFTKADAVEIMICSSNKGDNSVQTEDHSELFLQESTGAVMTIDDLTFGYGETSSNGKPARKSLKSRR